MQTLLKKIYIAGSGGMLGDAFYSVFSKKFITKCSDKVANETWLSELDFTNYDKYKSEVVNFNADCLIHLGAMTNLEECELNPDQTYLNNTKSVEYAVKISNDMNIPIIFISTAGIFDGKKDIYDDFPFRRRRRKIERRRARCTPPPDITVFWNNTTTCVSVTTRSLFIIIRFLSSSFNCYCFETLPIWRLPRRRPVTSPCFRLWNFVSNLFYFQTFVLIGVFRSLLLDSASRPSLRSIGRGFRAKSQSCRRTNLPRRSRSPRSRSGRP